MTTCKTIITCLAITLLGAYSPALAQLGSGWVQYNPTKKIHLDNEEGLQTFTWTTYKAVGTGTNCADYSYDAATETETFRIFDSRSNRSEIRLQNEYNTGSRQFEGYVTFYAPLNDESLMQIFGSISGATQLMNRGFAENGGSIKGGGKTLITGCYGVEVRLNVIHLQEDVGNKIIIYINGEKKAEIADNEQPSAGNYHKYGCYGTTNGNVPAVVKWRRVRSFKDGTAPTWTVTATPANLSMVQNGTVTTTINTLSFTSNCTLSASGLPTGVTASFNPAAIASGTGTSTLTLTAANNVATGYYPVTINASDGTNNATTNVNLQIIGPPEAPGNLTATAVSSNQINLTWQDNSTSETGFLIERSEDGTSWAPVTTTAANVVSYPNTGVTYNKTYYYRVSAINSAGSSSYSNTANTIIPNTAPAAPGNFTAKAKSTSQIDLSWTDNANNESSFVIEQSADGINWTPVATATANTTAYSHTGLSTLTTYQYRINSVNDYGNSAYANVTATTLDVPPAAPGNLVATAVSDSQIDLSWTDNSANETGFRIECSLNQTKWDSITTVAADIINYSSIGLEANTQYYYRVLASNTGGKSTYSNTANATTQNNPNPPTAPTSLVAILAYSNLIKLTWVDNANNESNFTVERSLNGTDWNNVSSTIAKNSMSYSDYGLNTSTKYFYRVKATNTNGSSAYTNTADATTQTAGKDSVTVAYQAEDAAYYEAIVSTGYTGYNGTGLVDYNKVAGSYVEWTIDSPVAGPLKMNIRFANGGTTNRPMDIYVNGVKIISNLAFNSTGAFTNWTTQSFTVTFNTGINTLKAVATDASNGGPNVDELVITYPKPLTPLGIPTNLTATPASDTQINLTWTDNSNAEEAFKIERSPDAETWTEIGSVVTNVITYSNTGLTPNTQYYYRVIATNTGGTSADYSPEAVATTPGPPAVPANLSVVTSSSTRLNLTWTDASSNETNFKIERSTDESTWTLVTTLGANTTSYSDNGLIAGTKYFYRIFSTNTYGSSVASNTASATTAGSAVNDMISSVPDLWYTPYPSAINFYLPAPSITKLVIYNLKGYEITLLNQYQSAGIKTVFWDTYNVPAGLYVAKLVTRSGTKTIKLMVVK